MAKTPKKQSNSIGDLSTNTSRQALTIPKKKTAKRKTSAPINAHKSSKQEVLEVVRKRPTTWYFPSDVPGKAIACDYNSVEGLYNLNCRVVDLSDTPRHFVKAIEIEIKYA